MRKISNLLRSYFLFLLFFEIVLLPFSNLRAQTSPLQIIQEKTKAVVTVQSVNATVFSGKPQGLFDKSTGLFLILNKLMPVGYERSGNGVIIDSQGIVVTNSHIVKEASGIAVTLFDGTRVFCKQVFAVPNTDLAFLLIDPPFPLSSISFAKAEALSEGIDVYTIGHSEWIKGSLIGGKISGIKRELIDGTPHATYLRVTFSVYKGDSGSPILDQKGNLLGIICAGQEGRDNTTFALSSDVIELAYQTFGANLKK